MKNVKRIISLVLALMLAVSMLAMPSLAAKKPDPDAEIQTAYSTCKTCGLGTRSYKTAIDSTSRKWMSNGCSTKSYSHYHEISKYYDYFECANGHTWRVFNRTVDSCKG